MVNTETKDAEQIKILDNVDLDKLSMLKAKLAKKEESLALLKAGLITTEEIRASEETQEIKKSQEEKKEMTIQIVEKKTHSIKLGFVGSGQCGSRIAEEAFKLGYETVIFNTASQDLEFISIPKENKLLLDYGLGGAAKDLSIGAEAAHKYHSAIYELIHEKLKDSQVFVFCVSLGGGSGAGSIDTFISIMNELGKPVIILCALPMESDDQICKQNSLESLAKLSKYTQDGKVQNIILVDNAQIQNSLSDVSEFSFFEVANKLIIEPLEIFNYYSAQPSPSKSLDSMEFTKLLLSSQGLSTFGSIVISDFQDETAIAEAVVSSLESNLLAKGFDLKQSKYVGFMVIAPKNVWDKIPSSSISYASAMLGEVCGTPESLFKGLYISDKTEEVVKIYSVFTGLGLPSARIETLKKETIELSKQTKNKDKERNLNLSLSSNTDTTSSVAQKIRDKISSKKGAFNQFLTNIVKK